MAIASAHSLNSDDGDGGDGGDADDSVGDDGDDVGMCRAPTNGSTLTRFLRNASCGGK